MVVIFFRVALSPRLNSSDLIKFEVCGSHADYPRVVLILAGECALFTQRAK